MGSRVLTVSSSYPYTTVKRGYIEVPIIRLQGKWLHRLGFKAGSKVQVTCQGYGELCIKLVKEESGQ